MRRSLTKIDRRSERIIWLVVGAEADALKIPVYNQLLRNVSPEFEQLVDSMDTGNSDLEILGVSKKTMSILIEYIYETFKDRDASLPITEENVQELSFAGNKFGLRDVQSLCDDFLESIENTVENCIPLFVKSWGFTSASFKRKCLESVLSSLAQLVNTQDFLNLTFTHLGFIINEGRAQGKCSEEMLCEAAIHWLNHRSGERSLRVNELIDEFPSRDHKLRIIQTLFHNPNHELKTMAFGLLSDLYKQEAKTETINQEAGHSNGDSPPDEQVDPNHNNTQSNEHDDNVDAGIIPGENNISRDANHTFLATDIFESSDEEPVNSEVPEVQCDRTDQDTTGNTTITDKNSPTVARIHPLQRTDNSSVVSLGGPSTSSQPTTMRKRKKLFTGTSPLDKMTRLAEQSLEDCTSCTIYFLTHACHLWSFNLHSYKLSCIEKEAPRVLWSVKNSSLLYYSGQIYFMGGKCSDSDSDSLSTNDMCTFNLMDRSWNAKNMQKMHQPRYAFQTVRLDKWMFVIGGFTMTEGNRPVVSGVCEKLMPISRGKEPWKELPDVLWTPRYALVAVATKNEIYAIGGRTQRGERLRTVEFMRADSDVWEIGPDLTRGRAYASAVYCPFYNAIFVFGGDSIESPSVEKLDLTTKTWSIVSENLPANGNYYSVAYQPCELMDTR